MENFQHIASFMWNVADDVLGDDVKRLKYPDVILPFTVLRRIDCVLAPTRENVLNTYNEQNNGNPGEPFTPPRPLEEIEADIKTLEAEILVMVEEMMG